MIKELEELLDTFKSDLNDSTPSEAINGLRESLADYTTDEYPMTSEDMTLKLMEFYQVSRSEAQHFIQECDGELVEHYSHNILSIEDKIAVLQMARNTDIPTMTGMKKDLVLDVLKESLDRKDYDLFQTAVIKSDGINVEMFNQLKNDIINTFTFDEAYKAELVVSFKENHRELVQNLNEQLNNNEISLERYRESMEIIENNTDEKYMDAQTDVHQMMVALYIEKTLKDEIQNPSMYLNIHEPDPTIMIDNENNIPTTLYMSDFKNDQMIDLIKLNKLGENTVFSILHNTEDFSTTNKEYSDELEVLLMAHICKNTPMLNDTRQSIENNLCDYIKSLEMEDMEDIDKLTSILPLERQAEFQEKVEKMDKKLEKLKIEVNADVIRDNIVPPNIQPDDETYVSEILQKFANYISVQITEHPQDTESYKHIEQLSATFNEQYNEVNNEQYHAEHQINKEEIDERDEEIEKEIAKEEEEEELLY